MPFFQDGPVLSNLYAQDRFLKVEFPRRVPAHLFQEHDSILNELGRESAQIYSGLQDESDRNPPKLTNFDPWGRRIDKIEVAKHWAEFRNLALRWGIVGLGHDKKLGCHARLVQTAYMLLYSPTTANYLCPLAMSDAAACVLRGVAPNSLKTRLYPRLISRDPNISITSGQWMTERPGGSDVSRSETLATLDHNEGEETRYRLSGVKWFTSSITSEMSLLLAQVQGAPQGKALTLFCWERPEAPNLSSEAGVTVLRLKEKLGTRSLPTAEIELNGAIATQIGSVGRGVSHISEMLNITRFYNAVASAAGMNLSTLLVKDYVTRRRAFGCPIGEHVLMQEVVADLERRSSEATALCFEVARLIGLVESSEATRDEQLCMRVIVPLAKLILGKAAVAHASETLECFGGAGYVEDTGLPRILRDAQVLPIWEGTTNVLALDIWRAERKEGALGALIESMMRMDGSGETKMLNDRLQKMRALDDQEAHKLLRLLVFDVGEALQRVLAVY